MCDDGDSVHVYAHYEDDDDDDISADGDEVAVSDPGVGVCVCLCVISFILWIHWTESAPCVFTTSASCVQVVNAAVPRPLPLPPAKPARQQSVRCITDHHELKRFDN